MKLTFNELLEKIKKDLEERPTPEQRIAALESALTDLAIQQIKERDTNA